MRIMSEKDFEDSYHMRIADCCESCEWGTSECEEFATCSNPKRNDIGEPEESAERKYTIYNTCKHQICDLFQRRK